MNTPTAVIVPKNQLKSTFVDTFSFTKNFQIPIFQNQAFSPIRTSISEAYDQRATVQTQLDLHSMEDPMIIQLLDLFLIARNKLKFLSILDVKNSDFVGGHFFRQKNLTRNAEQFRVVGQSG
jgi:hypothetical protein